MRAPCTTLDGLVWPCPLLVAGAGFAAARAAELPSYFKEIVSTQTSSPAEIGTRDVLQLNKTMFELYGDAAKIFRKNILGQSSADPRAVLGGGGRFILYRPGHGRRSKRRRCRSTTSCSNRSATAPWRWPKWSFPI